MRDLQKIEENTQEIKIFTQWNIFWKNTIKNIYKKENMHILSYLNFHKTYQGHFCQTIVKQE